MIISCIRLINAYAVAFVLGIRGYNHTVSFLIFSCVVFGDIMSLLHRACYTCTGQTEIKFGLFSFWILFCVQTKKWKENNFLLKWSVLLYILGVPVWMIRTIQQVNESVNTVQCLRARPEITIRLMWIKRWLWLSTDRGLRGWPSGGGPPLRPWGPCFTWSE